MDTYQFIIQAISTVGFPIVACCAMFYLYNKIITELTATLSGIEKLLDELKEELARVKNA